MTAPRTAASLRTLPKAVRALRDLGFQTAILSGSPSDSLLRIVRCAGLSGAFDAVFSVGGIDAVKPDPRTYQIAVDELGIPKRAICFVSGNPWDAAGAAYFGFHVIPVARSGDYLRENLPENVNRRGRMHPPVASLEELPDRLEPRRVADEETRDDVEP